LCVFPERRKTKSLSAPLLSSLREREKRGKCSSREERGGGETLESIFHTWNETKAAINCRRAENKSSDTTTKKATLAEYKKRAEREAKKRKSRCRCFHFPQRGIN